MMNMKALLERLVGEKVTLMYSVSEEGKGELYRWEGRMVGVFGDLLVIENLERDWKRHSRFVTFDLTLINFHGMSADVNPLGDGDHEKSGSSIVM